MINKTTVSNGVATTTDTNSVGDVNCVPCADVDKTTIANGSMNNVTADTSNSNSPDTVTSTHHIEEHHLGIYKLMNMFILLNVKSNSLKCSGV